jgi:hypothetical protein
MRRLKAMSTLAYKQAGRVSLESEEHSIIRHNNINQDAEVQMLLMLAATEQRRIQENFQRRSRSS